MEYALVSMGGVAFIIIQVAFKLLNLYYLDKHCFVHITSRSPA